MAMIVVALLRGYLLMLGFGIAFAEFGVGAPIGYRPSIGLGLAIASLYRVDVKINE